MGYALRAGSGAGRVRRAARFADARRRRDPLADARPDRLHLQHPSYEAPLIRAGTPPPPAPLRVRDLPRSELSSRLVVDRGLPETALAPPHSSPARLSELLTLPPRPGNTLAAGR